MMALPSTRMFGTSTVLLVLVLGCQCSCPEVHVTGGAVVGSEQTSVGGRPYYAFRAVPFAGYVEGEHRFELPRPVIPWQGVLSCEEQGPMCAQSGYSTITGEEDCLHLSVYTPKMPSEGGDAALLPVLVWLPGGAFIVSGAADYDPSLLMDKDMVLVVPQYRLGLLGFLYAFSEGPGNYGMFDQLTALQWVQDNIAQFGGDPSRVTLGGDCAGGASALYHMIAPKSTGLFHRVLSLSGTPLSPWAKHPPHRRAMLVLAGFLKCPKADMADMMHCYRSLEKDELLEAQMYLLESRDLYVGNGGLAPVVQNHAVKRDMYQFLEEEPVLSFMDGHFDEVPVLLITSKDVGNYLVDMSLYEWMLVKHEEKGDKFKDEMPSILVKEMGVEPDTEYEKQILAEYLPGLKDMSFEEMLPGIGRMLGDALYNAGLVHTARYLNDKVPTWLLRFDFEAGPHLFNERHPDPTTAPPISPGAGHGDELHYFLPKKYQPFETEEQRRTSALMLEMIESFVNGLPPAQDWPAPSDARLECGVVTAKGTLSRDRLLSPRRLATSETIFNQQHKSTLRRREEDLKLKKPRDEL